MTLNLNDGSYKPFRKPDDIIQYINKESNYAPNRIKHLSTFINKWLSSYSAAENIFQKSAIHYEDTVNKTG